MASAAAADSEVSPPEAAPPPSRVPVYRDPRSLLGWGLALLALVAYWYFFVRRPAPKPGQAIARLTALEGRVKLRSGVDERWREARVSERLHVGDVLRTEAGSGAVILFDGDPREPGSGNVVRVRPDSVVSIGGSAESSTAAWRVRSGRVNFAVGDQATEIETPTVRATATRASGDIDVAPQGGTDVKVFQGQAELQTSLGQRITLAPNQAVRVDATGRAGAPLELPLPPTPVAPASRAQLAFVAPPAAITTLAWTAVAGGVSYRVAIDYNVTQADMLLSAALEQGGLVATEHPLRGLDPGRYFWRVAATSKDGLDGAFSRVSSFSVGVPATPPPASTPTPGLAAPRVQLLAAQEVWPGVVHVVGRTDPGSQVALDGNPLRVLPDGSFSEYVRHPGRGAVVVRVTTPDGRTAEQARPVVRR